MKKAARFLPLILGIVAVALVALFARNPAPQAPPPAPPAAPAKDPSPTQPPRPPAPPPAPAEEGGDPLLQRWKSSIRSRDQKAVLELQATFLSKETDYKEPLVRMAETDPDPRVRAFCIAVLGRMKTPPEESFFLERIGDENEYPKTSAAQALEKLGTKTSLEALDRLAAGDPAPSVRNAAAQAAKAVRSR